MATEQFRPEYHFTPAQNWQNDPNGLFYFGGQYHLYFQHNPFGDQWGNMSWGHAVSHDMLTWHQLPVAIPTYPFTSPPAGLRRSDPESVIGVAAGAPI